LDNGENDKNAGFRLAITKTRDFPEIETEAAVAPNDQETDAGDPVENVAQADNASTSNVDEHLKKMDDVINSADQMIDALDAKINEGAAPKDKKSGTPPNEANQMIQDLDAKIAETDSLLDQINR
jgi:hypothetical protein